MSVAGSHWGLGGLRSLAAVTGIATKPNANEVQLSRSDKVQSDCRDGAKGLAPSRQMRFNLNVQSGLSGKSLTVNVLWKSA
jgi:hypothetical protein